MKYSNKLLVKCYNIILNKDIIWTKYKKKHIDLKINITLKKNLILVKELY